MALGLYADDGREDDGEELELTIEDQDGGVAEEDV